MKKFPLATVFLTLFLGLYAITVSASQDPTAMLRSIADQMIAKLKQNQVTLKKNPGLVYSFANKIIVPHADLDAMSKRVLPPKTWNSSTPAQRSLFKKEFTTTLIRTYASAIAQYTDQTVQFSPVRGGYSGKTMVNVNSQIKPSDGSPINVTYKLISAGGNWRLIDLTVEGVSMLESFRSQFADQLSHSDINGLIQVLKQHNLANERADGNA
ncbi:MAG: ABC transporter substrate-binding protein [Gammaproteobacteria bacterium]|nr:ABC transporter substrate-binding protein [Gammaproteobacteria bacterium]